MKKLIHFLVCFSLITALNTTAFASFPTPSHETQADVFSSDFIAKTQTADGAYTYTIGASIADAFVNNPEDFIENLGLLAINDANRYSSLLISTMYYDGNWDAFKSCLSNQSNNLIASSVLSKAILFENQELEWVAAYEESKSQPAPEGLFSPKILLEAIASHTNTYTYDQEYCGYLREMYELDPVLFVQCIQNLSDDAISNLARQIAYAQVHNLGNVASVKALAYGTATSSGKLNATERTLSKAFSSEIASFSDNVDIIVSPAMWDSTPVPTSRAVTIGSMYYQNVVSPPNELEINKEAVLTTTISGLTANKQYKVELWARHDGSTTNHLKATKNYTANSSGKINAALNVTFSSPGDIWTTVKVYDGSTLVASRTGGASDPVYARWSIEIPLQSNHYGTLRFYYASGAQAYSCTALGKSANNTHYSVPNGNTPPGDYYGWTADLSYDRVTYPEASYGPYKVIKMEGNHDPGYSNLYVDGGSDNSKPRSGIWIHGGRDQSTYVPTYGCVRIHDADILAITNYMDNWLSAGYHEIGRVSITR